MLNGKTIHDIGYGKEKKDFQSFRFLRTRAKNVSGSVQVLKQWIKVDKLDFFKNAS